MNSEMDDDMVPEDILPVRERAIILIAVLEETYFFLQNQVTEIMLRIAAKTTSRV